MRDRHCAGPHRGRLKSGRCPPHRVRTVGWQPRRGRGQVAARSTPPSDPARGGAHSRRNRTWDARATDERVAVAADLRRLAGWRGSPTPWLSVPDGADAGLPTAAGVRVDLDGADRQCRRARTRLGRGLRRPAVSAGGGAGTSSRSIETRITAPGSRGRGSRASTCPAGRGMMPRAAPTLSVDADTAHGLARRKAEAVQRVPHRRNRRASGVAAIWSGRAWAATCGGLRERHTPAHARAGRTREPVAPASTRRRQSRHLRSRPAPDILPACRQPRPPRAAVSFTHTKQASPEAAGRITVGV